MEYESQLDRGGNSLLPAPDLLVVGEKKEWTPVEEFWMQKLQKVEEQYEQHMSKLEKKLLESKIHRRVIVKQDNDLKELRKNYDEKLKEVETFQKKSSTLERDLHFQKIETQKLEEKLGRAMTDLADTDKERRQNKYEIKKCSKSIFMLNKTLKRMEKEKKVLTEDASIREKETEMFKDREAESWQEKVQIFKNIRDLSTDKQIREVEKLKLQKSLGAAAKEGADRDRRIMSLRRELEEIAKSMTIQREAHDEVLREKAKTEKQLESTKEKVEQAQTKLDSLKTQILSWKEEMNYKEIEQVRQRSELQKLKSENRRLRSQLAEVTKNMTKLQNEIKTYEMERERVKVELKKTKAQDKAIQKLMRENAFQRLRLAEKVPKLQGAYQQDESTNDSFRRNIQGNLNFPSHYPTCPTKEIDGYKKKIWELERKLFDVERKIDEGRRRENTYRVKLQRFSAIKEQLFWTQRAMLRLEADRQGMDDMIRSFATTMPRKLPMEKLVTDPSILDRIAKQRVLQQRLADKAAQVEQMKEITNRLLQNEEKRRTEAVGRPTDFGAQQPWQLNYWKMEKHVHHEGRKLDGETEKDVLRSETDTNYYKDYVGFLSQEIPRIKDQLLTLERKKQYLRAMGQGSQSRSASTSIVDLHAEEYVAASPEGETEEETEEDEYEDDDEEYEDDEQDEENQGNNSQEYGSRDTEENSAMIS